MIIDDYFLVKRKKQKNGTQKKKEMDASSENFTQFI